MEKIKVAVLGYGHLGKWHCQKVEAHQDWAKLCYIVEKFPAAQEAAQKAHPNVKIVDDIEDCLNDIDAAFVVTPTSTHFELVKKILKAGKHVFCEKPLCQRVEEIESLKELLKPGLILQVGHSERFQFLIQKYRSVFLALPKPLSIQLTRVAPFKGRATDVDVVQDLAIHDLDLLLHVFNVWPKKLRAHGHKIRTKFWDDVSIDLDLGTSGVAHILVSRNYVKEVRELTVTSKEGCHQLDLFSLKHFFAPAGEIAPGQFVAEDTGEKSDNLFKEHNSFYQAIREKTEPVVSLNDGLLAVRLIEAVLQSLDTNDWVSLGQT